MGRDPRIVADHIREIVNTAAHTMAGCRGEQSDCCRCIVLRVDSILAAANGPLHCHARLALVSGHELEYGYQWPDVLESGAELLFDQANASHCRLPYRHDVGGDPATDRDGSIAIFFATRSLPGL